MAEEITMPPMGQTTKNLKILAWHKSEGDRVEQGDILLEVETDKAAVEVESYAAGTLLKVLHPEGDVVEVGSLIAYVGEPGEEVGAEAAGGDRGSAAPVHEEFSRAAATADAQAGPAPAGKVLASPVARKLARDHGLDIGSLQGTGPGGRVKKQDVLDAVETARAAGAVQAREAEAVPRAAGVPAAGAGLEGVPAQGRIEEPSKIRRAVAERLQHSFRNIPHIYLTARFDMSAASRTLRASRESFGVRLTYTHLILQAAGRALRREPAVNRLWLEDGRIKLLGSSSVGLAVAGEESLIVAAIPEPDRMSLGALAEYTAGAVKRARTGRLIGEDLRQCALTVSNLGMYGVEQFAAIIDPQQTAILAVGRIAEEPVVRDGGLFSRPMMSVTLSADHRVVDGVEAARFLAALGRSLEGIGE